jgi:hypothetical protein
MTNYEFIDNLNVYLKETYDIRLVMNKNDYLEAHTRYWAWSNKVGLLGRGTTTGRHGQEFRDGTYQFINWILEEEVRRNWRKM